MDLITDRKVFIRIPNFDPDAPPLRLKCSLLGAAWIPSPPRVMAGQISSEIVRQALLFASI
jgi:hypothetical protein